MGALPPRTAEAGRDPFLDSFELRRLPDPKLTLVLPAHNEAELIAASVRTVDSFLASLGIPYGIVVGDSASSDGTADRVTELRLPTVHVIRSPVSGKGAILTRCFQDSDGEILGFLDADLEIDVAYVAPMLGLLDRGYDAVIASKTLDPSLGRNRPRSRRATTAAYNAVARLLFGTPFRDHQAGLKLFRREPLMAALQRVASPSWLWDTELLVALVRDGRRVGEFPIETTPRDDSRFARSGSSLSLLGELARLYVRVRRS